MFPKKKGAWAGGVHEPREEQLLVFPLCVIEQQRALTNQDNSPRVVRRPRRAHRHRPQTRTRSSGQAGALLLLRQHLIHLLSPASLPLERG